MGRFLKKNIMHNEMSRKKVSFHSPFQLFLLPKNESTKTSINTINFHGKKIPHRKYCRNQHMLALYSLKTFFSLLLEDNHLKCVSNVMLKLHNSRNFSFARFLVGLLKYKPGKYTELS